MHTNSHRGKLSTRTKYAITGAAAGAANGFFGTGGGMLLVPLLIRWSKMDDRRALATSVCIIAPLSLASALVYFLRLDLSILDAVPFLLGGLPGGIIGGYLFKKIPATYLRKLLGVFIIWGGIRSLLP